jgi:hypothetical protein
MGSKTPILDLDALAPERPLIRIRTKEDPGGKLWELRTRPELGVIKLQRVYRIATEGQKLMEELGEDQIENLSEDKAQRLEGLLDELLETAFHGDYAEIRDELTAEQKIAVMHAFSESSLGMANQPGTTGQSQ